MRDTSAGRSALTACPSLPCPARTSFWRDRPLDLSRRRTANSVAVRRGPVARGLTTAKSTRAARSAVRGGGVWDNPYPRPGLQDLRGEIGELRRTARRTASQISVGWNLVRATILKLLTVCAWLPPIALANASKLTNQRAAFSWQLV